MSSTTINNGKTIIFRRDTKGELQNAYSPLQNLVNRKNILGDFTTKELNYDRYTPVDIVVTDEYDGSENLIINDDKNPPKLINSGFSVQENNTFNLPEHRGNAVTNIYEEKTFEKDTQLLKLYTNIPKLEFLGIKQGGSFHCGSYVFYFKLADADGNLSNIVQESGIVQVHVGAPNQPKVRMGLQDNVADKSVKFRLFDIDRGFDYVKVFYERTSTDESQARVNTYYMINQNFPIRGGICDITLTGEEDKIQIDKYELNVQFADIQSAKTQTVVDNILFLGNITAYEQDYAELQRASWRIIPSFVEKSDIGSISSNNYQLSAEGCYYNAQNVYENTGYWPDEYYRFGIVYIYENNLLSPVFNIQGCDLSKNNIQDTDFFKSTQDHDIWDQEPDDFIFKRDGMFNSKGVIKTPKAKTFKCSGGGTVTPIYHKLKFDFSHFADENRYIDPSDTENIPDLKAFFIKHHIKGFFFVRQKRIPSIIAQGMVIGLTGRYNGSIPVLYNAAKRPITKSFLNSGRLLLKNGSSVVINDENVSNKALLVPDYELDEATLNQIFTGQEFQLTRVGNAQFNIKGDHHCVNSIDDSDNKVINNVKLTAVPKDTKLLTDGENYFSSVAGNPDEPYKTEDVNNAWSQTPPQDLTASGSLIRGKWGSYVGMSYGDFDYGDIVNIKLNDFKNSDQDEFEFEKRFKDYSLYSAVSTRYNISSVCGTNKREILCGRGDCFPSLFTHRMMGNFIDPELPTNTQIVDPACWVKNYAVRCTAEILASTHSNLTSDSDGFYIPTPAKKSSIVSIIFGILTGNIGTVIKGISDLTSSSPTQVHQDKYANEICQAFEVYIGGTENGLETSTSVDDEGVVTQDTNIQDLVKAGHIKKVNPKEQEQQGGLNLKAIFKSDDKWELHGLASINRSDVNAVSFGSWITFPICSPYNIAFRDIDFSNATEEASMNKKRSFYPLEEMNPENHLLESNVINGAAKVSIGSLQNTAYLTVPYIKQEFFNRIYWSKPNVSEAFINSYRIIFNNQYHEYNKEFGSITKLVELGNSLLVVFQHGLGLLPVNRTPQNEQEQSPYLSSKSVLPTQVQTLTADYGSMWKDSVIKSPYTQQVYGVDTVAKKIWKVGPQGNGLEFISDFKVQKFLNDWIDLSEYDFNEYQGHINVKTHYNEFKHDVIFTYYKDIPMTKHEFVKVGNEYKITWIGYDFGVTPTEEQINNIIPQEVDLSGNLILSDTIDPKPLIDYWQPGTIWSLCYNEITKQFITFYDWYPVESCNVDNIFFSFDKEAIDDTYDDNYSRPDALKDSELQHYTMNKVFADKMFTENTEVYILPASQSVTLTAPSDGYISLYYKGNCPIDSSKSYVFGKDTDTNSWTFTFKSVSSGDIIQLQNNGSTSIYILDCWFSNPESLTIKDSVLKYQELRTLEGPQMYLWKHGQAGLYDNQGKIKPTHWYGKQHEFNVEFIVNQDAQIQKIFNNLKIISNKTVPNKFEYEIVGEGYDWFDLKPVILWINKNATDQTSFENLYKEVLTKTYDQLINDHSDFPELFGYEGKTIKKIPFLHLETCDKYGRQDKSYHQDKPDFWSNLDPTKEKDEYSFNTSEVILVEDDQLHEQRVHTEQLGNDVKKYGRLRGNMQYLEDLWDVEIRPIKFNWAYISGDELAFAPSKEARHRDKYIKIKVRYSGKDLAVIQGIITMFDYSMA